MNKYIALKLGPMGKTMVLFNQIWHKVYLGDGNSNSYK